MGIVKETWINQLSFKKETKYILKGEIKHMFSKHKIMFTSSLSKFHGVWLNIFFQFIDLPWTYQPNK